MEAPDSGAPGAAPDLLVMRGIGKRFAGVTALSNVTVTARPGEVLALMGENGAGKSTLMKILGGVQPPDGGEIRIDGEAVTFDGVGAARARGIVLIHQELMLAPNLDIASNVFLGSEGRRWLAPLPRREAIEKTAKLLARVGLDEPPTTLVGTLSVGQRQMVEIARALSVSARIIVMDEPTASLSADESQRLFAIIRQLRADGVAIIYISHRMEEVLELSDRIAVLRDGRNAGELSRKEATTDKIVALMVGRELTGGYFPPRPEPDPTRETLLEVKDLLVPGAPAGVSFNLRCGEILGFAGLVGAGRTELAQSIFGVTPARGGSMRLDGKPFAPRRPRDAVDRGVYLAPEDRKKHGLILPMSVAQNTSLPAVGSYNGWGWLDRKTERRVARAEVTRMATKTPTIDTAVGSLSGGNQQKVVLGKWLAMKPRVLILDEPTRGIDVGARAEIYRHIAALAEQGIAILMISSDLEEVMGLSDRVAVMRERRLVGIVERAALSPQRLGAMMTTNQGAAA
jgi:ribose transport system ATP-binding protein